MLRRATLTELGGAQTIVQSHLDAVMAGLSPQQVQVAAAVFYHLITASGSKIALTAEDLADWADVPSDRVHDLLEALSSGPRRILRPVPPATGAEGPPGYEIFHDVMQGPCKVSFARADLRFWRQRPESCLLSHNCALDLHGQHSAPAQVRATWWLIWRRDGPDSTPDRSLSTPASAQVNRLSDDVARAL